MILMKHSCKLFVLGIGLLASFAGCRSVIDEMPSYDELKTCTPENGVLKPEELPMFAGCQRLDGSVVLGDGFPDRSSFRSIVVITGNLNAGGMGLDSVTLEGFESLEIVEGQFGFNEDNLRSYAGVPKLWRAGGFSTTFVPELLDFRGLEGLREVQGNFTISYNPKVQSLAGLEGLERVYGDVRIGENPELPASEIDAFLDRVTVDGEVLVW